MRDGLAPEAPLDVVAQVGVLSRAKSGGEEPEILVPFLGRVRPLRHSGRVHPVPGPAPFVVTPFGAADGVEIRSRTAEPIIRQRLDAGMLPRVGAVKDVVGGFRSLDGCARRAVFGWPRSSGTGAQGLVRRSLEGIARHDVIGTSAARAARAQAPVCRVLKGIRVFPAGPTGTAGRRVTVRAGRGQLRAVSAAERSRGLIRVKSGVAEGNGLFLTSADLENDAEIIVRLRL